MGPRRSSPATRQHLIRGSQKAEPHLPCPRGDGAPMQQPGNPYNCPLAEGEQRGLLDGATRWASKGAIPASWTEPSVGPLREPPRQHLIRGTQKAEPHLPCPRGDGAPMQSKNSKTSKNSKKSKKQRIQRIEICETEILVFIKTTSLSNKKVRPPGIEPGTI